MGTNIVRLTDREYMRTLRDRIDEDYRNQLEKRIKTREQREIERERLLIIEGKSNEVPRELFHDPIFVVNREVEQEILFQRSKMKTTKEKNAIRLRQATLYWERERQIRDIEEKQREEKVMNRINNEKMLEEQYQRENDERGMDLLRYIYSPHGRSAANWRPCELDLKDYLESERAKMKARENIVSKQFNSDPKDLRNIIAARKEKLRAERAAKAAAALGDQLSDTSRSKIFEMGRHGEGGYRLSGPDGAMMGRGRYPGDSDETIMSDDFEEDEGSTLSESVRAHAEMLDDEISQDIKRGFIISRAQYEDLRYEEVKITKLRQARNINELYQLAEEIILGDRPVEEDQGEEEHEEEEEEEVEEEESSAESY
ncbi:DNA ligase 1 isoform X2 [Teleopsis dalmanni]|nr:DNA ligase 1 isoform X2 [Teleopsis dalmanni]